MSENEPVAARLAAALGTVLGVDRLPVRLRAWDGSTAGPDDAPEVVVRSPQAVRRLVWAPGELGLARAYVSGELDAAGGELYDAFSALSAAGRLAPGQSSSPSVAERVALLRTGLALGVVGREPPPPPEEVRVRRYGRRHSRRRDAAAVSHHYDVGNDFYRLVLGPSMVYSCAVWDDESSGLDAAQEAKLDLVCRKLGAAPGHAAAGRRLRLGQPGDARRRALRRAGRRRHALRRAGRARPQARRRGRADRPPSTSGSRTTGEIDDGPFDAISSVGHGRARRTHAAGRVRRRPAALLRPGGRLLNHAISWDARATTWHDDSFIARYVFPDGELISLGDMVDALERGRPRGASTSSRCGSTTR